MGNLWPEGFEQRKIQTPKEILEEQTRYLPKLTGDLVYASIEDIDILVSMRKHIHGDFSYSFTIRGKFLPQYKYVIFYFTHGVEIYPLKVVLEDDQISKEIGSENSFDVNDENQFITLLKLIFNSKRLGNIISSIMALSK